MTAHIDARLRQSTAGSFSASAEMSSNREEERVVREARRHPDRQGRAGVGAESIIE